MNKNTIKKGLDAIAQVDKQVALALPTYGYPAPRQRPGGFPALLSIIVNQQISVAAAATILARVHDALGEVSAESLLKTRDARLRKAGMSGRKVEYARGLAQAIAEGELDLEKIKKLEDEQAIEHIVALRGFGRWSAEIYLMFSLRRKDIFAADDLALQVALQRLKKLPERPTAKEARELTEHWAPWRSAGSLFLWHYYKGMPAL